MIKNERCFRVSSIIVLDQNKVKEEQDEDIVVDDDIENMQPITTPKAPAGHHSNKAGPSTTPKAPTGQHPKKAGIKKRRFEPELEMINELISKKEPDPLGLLTFLLNKKIW